jgi:hypothetical protein
VIRKPCITCRSEGVRCLIIEACETFDRPRANPLYPCLLSTCSYPIADLGATATVRGGVWLYEGPDIASDRHRIEQMGWHEA